MTTLGDKLASAAFLGRMLWAQQQFRRRMHWTRAQIEAHQRDELAKLRAIAYARSPFYRAFHRGLEHAPLASLPVLTKHVMMDNFGDVLTERGIDMPAIERFFHAPDRALFQGRYYLTGTSGSTGSRAFFLSTRSEQAIFNGSASRVVLRTGVKPSIQRMKRVALVASTQWWTGSAAAMNAIPGWARPGLHLDASQPFETIVAALDAFKPQTLQAYPSMLRLLALAQLEGKLHIAPEIVCCGAEMLTPEMRGAARRAWNVEVFDQYGTTEGAALASECAAHTGLHLNEDLCIVEIVDNQDRPVAPGELGHRVLVTALFRHLQPLIRYELTDTVRLADAPCPCGSQYQLISAIEGRQLEILEFPTPRGNVALHPVAFLYLMDDIPVRAWQIVKTGDELRVLIVEPANPGIAAELERRFTTRLAAEGVTTQRIVISEVAAIPRGATGKAPLIMQAPPP